MDRENARALLKGYLKPYVESITKRSKSKDQYDCPLCPSGTGRNKTGAFSLYDDGERWKCFSCDAGGDIFDLIGRVEKIEDYNEQLKWAAEHFNVPIDAYHGTAARVVKPKKKPEPEEEKEPDYTDLFSQASKDIGKTGYHRGISLETLARFNIGFIAKWKHPKRPRDPYSPRLIIPTGKGSYLARDTRDKTPEGEISKSKVGKMKLFNKAALYEAEDPVFVTEGEIDALSIVDVGGEAVALGSTAGKRLLLTAVEEKRPAQPLILALDNDGPGKKVSDEIAEGLKQLQIPFYQIDITQGHKDANEAMEKNREAFRAAVEQAIEQVKAAENAEQEAEREAYLKTSAAHYIQSFINGVADSVNTPYISTGFKKLDDVLDGGLYEGLYIVGAISSLGKTTLITQIADQIAQSGQDVLIFSLEMAMSELMAKSISRHTLQQVLKEGGNIQNAKTTRGITTGKRYEKYSLTENMLILTATEAYRRYSDHIFISEGMGDIGAEQIRETVKRHIRFTGNTPTVIVDYLQILAPYNERATDKQNTDKSVMELKRISRDYKTPVIGISSLNRAGYSAAVTMEAFKESGAIEYSSDVLIGLQLKGVGEHGFDATEAKKKSPREIELVILKNRNGRAGDKLGYKYYPLFNYFEEE